VAFCRVSYRDTEDIHHAVEVEGESLYECMDPPSSACQLSVKMLKKVVDFALHGTAKGPQNILRKKRIKELLGLD
jgi:hypothetical protein